MSQRLRKTMRDGQARDGLILRTIMGSAPDGDPEDQQGQENGSSGSGSGSGESEEQSEGGKPEAESDEEREALRKRMQAADRRAAAAEQRLKEIEDAAKTEEEKRSERLTALETENKDLRQRLSEQQMQNAFLTSNDYQWHDPEAALRLADLSEVVGEDGEVDKSALKRALKTLAEKRPFLVKPQGDDSKEEPPGASGTPVGSGRGKDKNKIDEQVLRSRYPALQQH